MAGTESLTVAATAKPPERPCPDSSADESRRPPSRQEVASEPATAPAETWGSAAAAGSLSEEVGPYRIERKLGAGGMGTVYLAEQSHPVKRKVALKLLREGLDSEGLIARFEAERQALAIMEHPNIAKVYDAGTTPEGQPYFAMEWVRGETVVDYCDRRRLGVAERIELFLRICAGVQHAHEKGVIHRDIKPSNLLVEEVDGRHVPKIIDFGVAKALGDPLAEGVDATLDGQMVGTPQYMSPEQAEGRSREVDVRSDVYSLGVVLHELLTGETPITREEFREAGILAMGELIRDYKLRRPSTRITAFGETATEVAGHRATDPARLSRHLRNDLDWIVLRALDPVKERRYAGAGHLAADLRRHLEHQPVEASPPSVSYRVAKFAKRHRAFFGGAVAVSLALILGIAAATMQAYRATRSEKIALVQEQSARARTLADLAPSDALALSLDAAERDADLRSGTVSATVLSDLLHVLEAAREIDRFDAREAYRFLAACPHGRFVATGRTNWVLYTERETGGSQVFHPFTSGDSVAALAVLDGDILVGTSSGFLYRVSPERGSVVWRQVAHEGSVALVEGFEGEVPFIVTAGTDRRLRRWHGDGTPFEEEALDLEGHLGTLSIAAVSRDGSRVVAAGDPLMGSEPVCLVDFRTGEVRSAGEQFRGETTRIAFSNDPDTFFTLDLEGLVRRWHWSGRAEGTFSAGRVSALSAFAHHPVEPMLFLAYEDGEIHARDWLGNAALPPLRGHGSTVHGLAFDAAGADLLSVSHDKSLRVWDLLGLQTLPPLPVGEKAESVLFSRDGARLAVGTVSGRLRIFDLPSRSEEESGFRFASQCNLLVHVPNSDRYLAADAYSGEVAFLEWPAREWRSRLSLPEGRPLALAVHPDAEEFAVLGNRNEPFLWRVGLAEADSDPEPLPFPVGFSIEHHHTALEFSEDGRHLLLRGMNSIHAVPWAARAEGTAAGARHDLVSAGADEVGFRRMQDSELFVAMTQAGGLHSRIEKVAVPSFESAGAFLSPHRHLDAVAPLSSDRFIALVDRSANLSIHDWGGAVIGPGVRANLEAAKTRGYDRHPSDGHLCFASLNDTLRFWQLDPDSWVALARRRLDPESWRRDQMRRTPWTVDGGESVPVAPVPRDPPAPANPSSASGPTEFTLGSPDAVLPIPEGWGPMDPASLAIFSRLAQSFAGEAFRRGRVVGGLSGPFPEGGALWDRPVLCVASTDEFHGEIVLERLERIVGVFAGRTRSVAEGSSAISATEFGLPYWHESLRMLAGESFLRLGEQSFEVRYYVLPTRSRLLAFIALGGDRAWPQVEEALAAIRLPPEEAMDESFFAEAPRLVAEILESRGPSSRSERFGQLLNSGRTASEEGRLEDATALFKEALALAEPLGIRGEGVPDWVGKERDAVLLLAKLATGNAAERRELLLSHLERIANAPEELRRQVAAIERFPVAAHETLADIAEAEGDAEAALDHLETAVGHARAIFGEEGGGSLSLQIVNFERRRGAILRRSERTEEAIAAYEGAVAQLESLPPGLRSQGWAVPLLDSLDTLVHFYRETGKRDTAAETAEKQFALAEEYLPATAETSPDNLWRLARSRFRGAEAVDATTPEGLPLAVERRLAAEELFRTLAEQGALIGYRVDIRRTNLERLADSQSLLADRWSNEGEHERAEAAFTSAVEFAEALLAERETEAAYNAFAVALARRATHWHRAGVKEKALEDRLRILAARAAADEAAPSPERRRRMLAARRDLVSAYRELDRFDDAYDLLAETLDGFRDLIRSHPDEWGATHFGSALRQAYLVELALGNEEALDALAEEWAAVAREHLTGATGRDQSMALFWALWNYTSHLRDRGNGSPSQLADAYREAVVAVDAHREGPDAPESNFSRALEQAEEFLESFERGEPETRGEAAPE